MKYAKIKNGYLFAYDENNGLTLKYKNEKWIASDVNFDVVIRQFGDVDFLNEKEVNTMTKSDAKMASKVIENYMKGKSL